ncbi:trypsin-like peptidase [Geothermobacter ehrlichii]|uniref:Trypsin-like peptidase n=1 Tax=Geothermobacter ehrlichii TaxID=213224 RepID=A0A5D3WMW0_9BACT|nr:S1C family serine protease [Geothermobacter ehrlichii]TYP00353.1 trypsin-like peptidase [Geothermobacter ehrlichii]
MLKYSQVNTIFNITTHEIRKVFTLVLSTIFLAAIPSIVLAQTAQEIARKAFSSTVLLVMEDSNGQPLSLGSGFFVRKGEIASNLHVVEGAARGYAKIIGQKTKYDIEGITAVDPERDLVVLKISGARAGVVTLGNSESVQVGEIVYAVGNPQGLEGTFSQGIVSSIREIGADKLLQITAPISPGSSGGPVLNGKGEVIGVSVATFKGGQNLNFAIPSNYLKSLLEKVGPAKPLGQAKPTKPQRSILSNLGGRGSEGVIGGQLTWTYETLQSGEYAISLRNKLRDNVRNIYCLVIFYDSQGYPIDVDVVHHRGVIPAGLAKRVTSRVDGSVQKLTTPVGSMSPRTKIEFRILDFEIVN